MPSLCSK